MKKIFTLTLATLITAFAFAGDENELKNFRFGLKVTPSVNWYKPDGKIMAGNGAGVKFGGGVILEFRLAKVASLQTGIQIDMDGGKIKYNNGGINTNGANTVSYDYTNADDVIAEYNSRPSDSLGSYQWYQTHNAYQLNERKFKCTYITIPLALKLKTKEIGSMTYFGQFGINSSIRWKANATDKVTQLPTSNTTGGANETKSKVDITKDMSFFTAAVNFGLGTEMNLSGSTSLLIGVNYNLGFLNVVKKQSGYLEKRTNGADMLANPGDYSQAPMPQIIKSNGVVLTVGVLF